MPVDPSLHALVGLVSPEQGADEQVDWSAVEQALGTRLPSDYVAFMTTYGAGDFGEALGVLAPLPLEYQQWDPGSIQGNAPQFRALWDEDGGVPGVRADSSAVLPWGSGCNANELGWLMLGYEPDDWPVVAWRRQIRYDASRWAVFECGMADFLVRLMRAEFDACPLGDASLWGKTAPFVHWREQERRWFAGLDPVTGEPDPLVQEFLQWPKP